MTNQNKAELRRLAEAATAGEWFKAGDLLCFDEKTGESHGLNVEDERFIAAGSPAAILSLLDECDSLERFKTAYMEWHEKTDWVRKDAKPKELGMHVADMMTARITQAEAERDAALADAKRLRREIKAFRNNSAISHAQMKWLDEILSKEAKA